VVVFLMWMYLTSYVILLGAELDAEMERQTKKDTTAGPEKPMGQRGAYAADTLGDAKGKK
jgi:membrane protein